MGSNLYFEFRIILVSTVLSTGHEHEARGTSTRIGSISGRRAPRAKIFSEIVTLKKFNQNEINI